VDIIETELDFAGKTLRAKATHQKGGETIVTLDHFTYDQVGRLTEHTQRINNGPEQRIAQNTYDALGQLKQKRVGGTAGGAALQTIDYGYNIRGWLRSVNDPSNLGSDLFAFAINYNTGEHGGTPLYNGNIAETEWRTANVDNSLKWYRYEHDALNRILSATDNTGNYNVSGITYDKMGNIQSLTRNGWQNGSDFMDMDVLDYDYDSGNKLLKVADTGNDLYGFKDDAVNTTDTTDDYSYDLNGNLLSDANKGITLIEYNHLNMPTKITTTGSNAGTLDYVYDATGGKIRKINSNGTTTDYIGNFVYEGSNLKQISHMEGYIEPNGNNWQYVYHLKDLQNNVRMTFADDNGNGDIDPSSEIRREQNYFPFGLEHKGYNNASYGVENNLKTYQDQEFTKDLGLDTHEWSYRMSDPAIGRFWQVDPLA